ncbi:MAG: hypothetical protein RLZZ15_2469 [Verrucomicrobiota bacterium]
MESAPNYAEPEFVRLQRPLEIFRLRGTKVPLHPRERWLVGLVTAHLVLLPWAIGGRPLWTQFASLAFALVGFIAALIPRDYAAELAENGVPFRLVMWPKLVRFPLFWIGLAFVAYVAAQGLNPAWEFQEDSSSWWTTKVPFHAWLPSGVRAPLERGGAWRGLLVYASIWLTLSTLWVGFTRRRALQFLLTAIAVNGFVLAVVGIVQKVKPNGLLLWFYKSPNDAFFSSFIYKNHAGAFLNLTLVIACALGGWHYLRSLRRLDKSSPAGLFVFLATAISIAVLVSFSRGATLVMLVFLLAAIAGFVREQIRTPDMLRRNIVLGALLLLFGYFMKNGYDALQSHEAEAWRRIHQVADGSDRSLAERRLVTLASLDMLQDTWPRGVGTGAWSLRFLAYQKNYPEILVDADDHGKQVFWPHAHNDILQFPIELGLAGTGLLLLGAAWIGVRLVRLYFWQNPLSLTLVLGLVGTLVHAWFDFVFQLSSVLLLFSLLLLAALQWAQMEASGQRA